MLIEGLYMFNFKSVELRNILYVYSAKTMYEGWFVIFLNHVYISINIVFVNDNWILFVIMSLATNGQRILCYRILTYFWVARV